MSANITFFEFISYFSPQGLITASESVPLPLYVPLSTAAHVLRVSSPVSPADTTEPLASKRLRDFRYVYTHWQKNPASKSVPTEVEDHFHQPSALTLTFLLPSAKMNGLVLIILFPISFFMTILILLFASLPCLYLLSLFLDLMRRQYWYQHGNKLWMRRWMYCFLKELEIWSILPKEQ